MGEPRDFDFYELASLFSSFPFLNLSLPPFSSFPGTGGQVGCRAAAAEPLTPRFPLGAASSLFRTMCSSQETAGSLTTSPDLGEGHIPRKPWFSLLPTSLSHLCAGYLHSGLPPHGVWVIFHCNHLISPTAQGPSPTRKMKAPDLACKVSDHLTYHLIRSFSYTWKDRLRADPDGP